MAKLSTAARKALPSSAFALPGGRYPIPDASHARNALARAAQNASPAEQATIRRKVKARYFLIKMFWQYIYLVLVVVVVQPQFYLSKCLVAE